MFKPLVLILLYIYSIVAKEEDNMDKKKSEENSKMLRQEKVEKLKLVFSGIQTIGIILLVI
jgi:hypothetical protein